MSQSDESRRAQTEQSDVSERRGMLQIEKGPGFEAGLADFSKHFSAYTLSVGVIPVFVICLTVGAVLVSLLTEAGLSRSEIISWTASVYIGGGVISLVLATYYKQPIVGAFSIPGMVLVAQSLQTLSYPAAIGGFFLAGVIVLLLGLTGAMSFIVRLIPVPIMSGMIAGVLFSFVLSIIEGIGSGPIIGLASIAGYIIFHKLPKVPGILGTVVFGGVAALVGGGFDVAGVEAGIATPVLHMPSFSIVGLVSVAIPLAILVIGAENMQAIGVIRSLSMKPPVNAMTIISGIGGIATSFFGGHNANVAGPTTATCASPEAGPVQGRYVAAIFAGITFIAFGLLAPTMVSLVGAIPQAFSTVLIGLVLFPIVARTFAVTWQDGKFLFGGLTAVIVAVSDLTILQISAPFWALVFGSLAALILETRSYLDHVRARE